MKKLRWRFEPLSSKIYALIWTNGSILQGRKHWRRLCCIFQCCFWRGRQRQPHKVFFASYVVFEDKLFLQWLFCARNSALQFADNPAWGEFTTRHSNLPTSHTEKADVKIDWSTAKKNQKEFLLTSLTCVWLYLRTITTCTFVKLKRRFSS